MTDDIGESNLNSNSINENNNTEIIEIKENEEVNTNNEVSNEVTNNKPTIVEQIPKKKKKKHRFLKFLLFCLFVFLIIFGYKYIRNYIKQKKFNDLIKTINIDKNEEVILSEDELKLDSNKDGLTNKEKIDLGLNILSSDFDRDGLSDYDEINKYHSDPKKYSTSGDLLSDGYKISKGYDINKKYDEVPTINVSNSRVNLIATSALDSEAYYKDYNGSIPSETIAYMKPFRVYSFKGEARIKVDNPKNYDVISYDNINKKSTKIKYSVSNNEMVFNIKNDNPIIIAYKKSVLKDMMKNANSQVIDFGNSFDAEYIVISLPIVNYLLKIPVFVLEINNSKIGNMDNESLENILNNKSKDLVFDVYYTNSWGAKILDTIFGKLTNKIGSFLEGDNKSILDYLIVYKHVKSYNGLICYLFGCEVENNSNTEEANEIEYEFEEKYNNTSGEFYASTNFDVTVNAFDFSNPSTDVSEGGVCAGISYITTSIFNDYNLPKSKKKKYDLEDSAYDIIWQKKLHNYKSSYPLNTYSDDIHKNEVLLDSNTMSKPDNEVIKIINYYYKKTNNDVRLAKFSWAWNNAFDKQTFISSKTIDKVYESLKQNKIVSVFLLKSGAQHAINAYKLVEDKNDSDILYLKAYDNNFPDDMYWDRNDTNKKIKYDITITLKRQYKNTSFGVETYYLFDYSPFENSNYRYGNMNGETDFVMFYDENANVY